MEPNSNSVGVIGAGLMGHGIAYIMAAAGHPVTVIDRSENAIASLPDRLQGLADLFGDDSSAIQRIEASSDYSALQDVALVIEAATENLQLKQFIVAELEAAVPVDAIIATNTSALPITQIAEKAHHPDRIVGTHFWNPPHLVKLVEVVQAEHTSDECIDRTMRLLQAAGHHAVHVKKDIPGFIGNRLQHALKREAIALVADGVCDAKTIDDVVKHGFGRRLAVLGPLEQSDMVGLSLTKAIHDTLIPDLDRTEVTHPYLEQLIADGHTGMATGKGFRTWTDEEAASVRKDLNDFLRDQVKSK